MQNKKLLSVLLATLLLCTCVAGMLFFNANAADAPIQWTIANANDDAADATFPTLQAAFDSIGDNTTWNNGRYLYIKITSTDDQSVTTDANGILFGLETQFRQDGTRLPIVIEGGTLAPNFNSTDVACANSYTFKDLKFAIGALDLNFYAGSGMVEFNSVDLGATNNGVANLFGDNFTARAFAGWDADKIAVNSVQKYHDETGTEAKLISTGIKLSGTMAYGFDRGTSENDYFMAAKKGLVSAAGWTDSAWVGATGSDLVTAVNTSVSLTLDGEGDDKTSSAPLKVTGLVVRPYFANTPVSEVIYTLKGGTAIIGARNVGITEYKNSSAYNPHKDEYRAPFDYVAKLHGGYIANIYIGAQYTNIDGRVTTELGGYFQAAGNVRPDASTYCKISGVATAKILAEVDGNAVCPTMGNNSGTLGNRGICGHGASVVANYNYIAAGADLTHKASSSSNNVPFFGSKNPPNGPVYNYIGAGATITDFYGIQGASTHTVHNVIGTPGGEAVAITNFTSGSSSDAPDLSIENTVYGLTGNFCGSAKNAASVVNHIYAVPSGTLTFIGEVEVGDLTNNIYCSLPGAYDASGSATVTGDMTTYIEADNKEITINGAFSGLKSGSADNVSNTIKTIGTGKVTIKGFYYGSQANISGNLTNTFEGTASAGALDQAKGVKVINDSSCSILVDGRFLGANGTVGGNLTNTITGAHLKNSTGSSNPAYFTTKAVGGDLTSTLINTRVNGRLYNNGGAVGGNSTIDLVGCTYIGDRFYGTGSTSLISGDHTVTFRAHESDPGLAPYINSSSSGTTFNGPVDGNITTNIYAGYFVAYQGMNYNNQVLTQADCVTNNITGGTFEGEFHSIRTAYSAPGAIVVNNVSGGTFKKTFYGANTNSSNYTATIEVLNNISGGTFMKDFVGVHTGGKSGFVYQGNVTNLLSGVTINEAFYGGTNVVDGTVSNILDNCQIGTYYYGSAGATSVHNSINNCQIGSSDLFNDLGGSYICFFGGNGDADSPDGHISTTFHNTDILGCLSGSGAACTGDVSTIFIAENKNVTISGNVLGTSGTASRVDNYFEVRGNSAVTVGGAYYGTGGAVTDSVQNQILVESADASFNLKGNFFGSGNFNVATQTNPTAVYNYLSGIAIIGEAEGWPTAVSTNFTVGGKFYGTGSGATISGNVYNGLTGVHITPASTTRNDISYGAYCTVNGDVETYFKNCIITASFYGNSATVNGSLTNTFSGATRFCTLSNHDGQFRGTGSTVKAQLYNNILEEDGYTPLFDCGRVSMNHGAVNGVIENVIQGGYFARNSTVWGENQNPATLTINRVYGGIFDTAFYGARTNCPNMEVQNHIEGGTFRTEFFGSTGAKSVYNYITGGDFNIFHAGSCDAKKADGEIETMIHGGTFKTFRGTGLGKVTGDPNRLNEDGYFAVRLFVYGGSFNYEGDSSTRGTAFYGTNASVHSVRVEVIESSRTTTAYVDGAPYFNNSHFYATHGTVTANASVRMIGLGSDDEGNPCYLRTHQLHAIYGDVGGNVDVFLMNYNAGGMSRVIQGSVGGDVNVDMQNSYIESNFRVVSGYADSDKNDTVGGNANIRIGGSIIKADTFLCGNLVSGDLDIEIYGLTLKDNEKTTDANEAHLYLGTATATVGGDLNVLLEGVNETVWYIGQIKSVAGTATTDFRNSTTGFDFKAFAGVAKGDVVNNIEYSVLHGEYVGAFGTVEGSVTNNISGSYIIGNYYGADATVQDSVVNNLSNYAQVDFFYGGGKTVGTGAAIINTIDGASVGEFCGSSAMGTDASAVTEVLNESGIFGTARNASEFATVTGEKKLSLTGKIYIGSETNIVADHLDDVDLAQTVSWSTGVVQLTAPIAFKDEVKGTNSDSYVEGFAIIDTSDGETVKVIGFRTESEKILASLSLDERISINLWLPKQTVDSFINVFGGFYEYKVTLDNNGTPVVIGQGTISKTSNADATHIIDGIIHEYYVVSLSGIGAGNFASNIHFTGSGFDFVSSILDMAQAGAQDYAGTDAEAVFQAVYDYGAAASDLPLKYDHLIGYTTDGVASPEVALGSQQKLSAFRIDALMGDAVGLRLTANANGVNSVSQIALKQDGKTLKQGRDYTVSLAGGKVTIEIFFGADYMSTDYAFTVTADGGEAITITTSVERVVAEIVKSDPANEKAVALLVYIQTIKDYKF